MLQLYRRGAASNLSFESTGLQCGEVVWWVGLFSDGASLMRPRKLDPGLLRSSLILWSILASFFTLLVALFFGVLSAWRHL
jgi:hypothetical protein